MITKQELEQLIAEATEEADCIDNNLKWRIAHYNLAAALDRILSLTINIQNKKEVAITDEYMIRARQITTLLDNNDALKKEVTQLKGRIQELSESCA